MNPLEDTLNIGVTVPRERATTNHLDADLDQAKTIRTPGSGSLVFGRYRLQRVLGRGGMGIVWLAVDTKLERAVALKFLPDIIGADPVALRELKDETRRGLELAHPNIVRIYDFIDDEEAAAISMEFVDGKCLSEKRLASPHKVFSTEVLTPWVGQMCHALDYAHAQRRIVHRDLKPANLMVNAESQLKIADFGIARSVSDTMSRVSMNHQNTSGTLLYMSPQQAMGDRPRPTDDIYAVGATLYELLTGKPPFYSGDISMQITSKTAPKLKERREELEIAATDHIPNEWEDVIAACLDKDPARRPQTAGELSTRLGLGAQAEAIAGSSVMKARNLQSLEVAPKTKELVTEKKKAVSPLLLIGLAALVLLMALAGSGLWWWTNRPGTLTLQTEPAGAKVTIGDQTFTSPVSSASLKAGTYSATVSLPDHEPQTVTLVIAAGQQAQGTISLARSTGGVLISSDPDGVPFEIKSTDNTQAPRVTGETPKRVTLPVGSYALKMKHEDNIKTSDFIVYRNTELDQSFKFPAKEVAPPAPAPVLAAADTPPPAPPASMPSSADTPPAATTSTAAGSPSAPALPATNPAGNPGMAAAAAAASAEGTPPASNVIAAAGPAAGPNNVAMIAAAQSSITAPESGSWKLDEILSNSSYSSYSEKGRRFVVYSAQKALKEQNHYQSSLDGAPGPGTHKAIVKFQTASSLPAHGQLDSVTLDALGVSVSSDNSDWSPPQPARRPSRSRSSDDDDGPNWWERNKRYIPLPGGFRF